MTFIRAAEAQRCDKAAFARTFGKPNTAHRSRHIPEVRHHPPRPFGWIIQSLQIIRTGDDIEMGAFVKAKKHRTVVVDINVSAAAPEPGDAEPLRHVLPIVPFIEFRSRLW